MLLVASLWTRIISLTRFSDFQVLFTLSLRRVVDSRKIVGAISKTLVRHFTVTCTIYILIAQSVGMVRTLIVRAGLCQDLLSAMCAVKRWLLKTCDRSREHVPPTANKIKLNSLN